MCLTDVLQKCLSRLMEMNFDRVLPKVGFNFNIIRISLFLTLKSHINKKASCVYAGLFEKTIMKKITELPLYVAQYLAPFRYLQCKYLC